VTARGYDAHVRASGFFAGLHAGSLERLCAAYTTRSAETDSFFFLQGEPAENVCMLAEGRVKMGQVTEDGQQVTMRIIVPGQLFGGVAVVSDHDAYPASAQALEGSLALAWKGGLFRELAGADPALGLNIAQLMFGHVQEMQTRVRELSTEKVQRRIARTLLRLAAQAGRRERNGILIDMPLSRQGIAELAGTTLFTVSRVLSEWERQGMIDTGRERVLIRDAHALVVVSEDIPL
jgi:CRP/FNR family transcriptional regulator, nitrogen oxide reductase regulator